MGEKSQPKQSPSIAPHLSPCRLILWWLWVDFGVILGWSFYGKTGWVIWKVENLFFHQVGQIWSYRALVKAFESSPRDLAIGHGFRVCSLQNKRNKLDFHTFGAETLFVTKSVRFGRTELSICRTGGESRDLEFEHGFRACSLKNDGNKLDFHTLLGGGRTEKKQES